MKRVKRLDKKLTLRVFCQIWGNKKSRDPILDWESWALSRKKWRTDLGTLVVLSTSRFRYNHARCYLASHIGHYCWCYDLVSSYTLAHKMVTSGELKNLYRL